MPSYVRTRLLAAREFAIGELAQLQSDHPAYDREIIEEMRALVGFDYFFFSGVDLDHCRTGANIVLMSDMPEEGVTAYHQSGLVWHDPLLTLVTPDRRVLAWNDVPEEVKSKPEVVALTRLLDRHHIPPRLMISQWNTAGQFYGTAGYARRAPFSPEEISILQWFSDRFHKELSQPILLGFNSQLGMTAGEVRTLELASQGLTSEEIASKIDLTLETVNSYLKAAIRKLNARNRSHAIADALRLGIIR